MPRPRRLGAAYAELRDLAALLLSSIDGSRAQFVREGTELLDRAVLSAHLLREMVAARVTCATADVSVTQLPFGQLMSVT